jgi:hypothetical protein
MTLGTNGLTIRPLQSTDVEAIASYSLRPEFIRFLPLAPQTMESAARNWLNTPFPTVGQIPKEIGSLPSRSGKSLGSSELYASASADGTSARRPRLCGASRPLGKDLPPGL